MARHARTRGIRRCRICKRSGEFLFGGISLCNQILYEFDQSSVDFEAKPSLVAEVLVMRAWFYLNAMDLFGNVPFTTDFSDTSLPRQVDRKFLFSFIEQQIKRITSACCRTCLPPRTTAA